MPTNGAVVQSLIFHGLVIGAFVIGMPYLNRDIAPEQPILTVEIVNVVPETSLDEGAEVKETPQPDPQPEEEPETPPPPPPPPPPPTPTPAAEPPPPAPKTADAVPVPSPEPKPVAAPKPEKPKSKPKPIKAPPKKPVKKSPVYKKAKENQLALASKLQDLTDRQATLRRQKEEEEAKKQKARNKLDQLVAKSQKANEEDDAKKDEAKAKLDQIAGQALNTAPRKSSLTGVSLGDLLRNHIGEHWSPPPGAAGADALIIDIIVRLNSQAEVMEVVFIDEARLRSDKTFKAAAEAAGRAIFDASPLPLPLDEFDNWKELRFKFDPRFITRR